MMRLTASPPDPDRRDVQAAQRGDAAAWQRLIARHGPRVYALCRRLDADPDDAYQAVWEKVCASLGRFDGQRDEAFGAWLHIVARRLLIDRHRKVQRRGEIVGRIVPTVSAPRAEQALQQQQRAARLEAALSKLPAGQRRVVVLHHIEGMSLEAIAREEDIAVGTVKSRLHRGRARLASLLGGSR